jgi:hypothetical protein
MRKRSHAPSELCELRDGTRSLPALRHLPVRLRKRSLYRVVVIGRRHERKAHGGAEETGALVDEHLTSLRAADASARLPVRVDDAP